jgi:hypothetical protein
MMMHRPRLLKPVMFVALAVVGFGSAPSAADRVSGLITRTYVIVEDTDVTGDVTCDVAGAPCFAFGAANVELRLNGFTISGRADAVTGCGGAATAAESGVNTGQQNGVKILGPGVIQRFRFHGVQVAGSRDVRVENITASTNCAAGIFVNGVSFGAFIQGNVAVRNGSTMPGFTCGGV